MHLDNLTDEQLFDHAVDAIWRAADGESRGGDGPSYGMALDFLEESKRRLTVAGHDQWCGGGIYSRAYEQAIAEHSYRTPVLPACTCGVA